MMAAVRCKRSKWPFIIATLCGWKWKEASLFRTAAEVPAGPAAVLAQVGHPAALARHPGIPLSLLLSPVPAPLLAHTTILCIRSTSVSHRAGLCGKLVSAYTCRGGACQVHTCLDGRCPESS